MDGNQAPVQCNKPEKIKKKKKKCSNFCLLSSD